MKAELQVKGKIPHVFRQIILWTLQFSETHRRRWINWKRMESALLPEVHQQHWMSARVHRTNGNWSHSKNLKMLDLQHTSLQQCQVRLCNKLGKQFCLINHSNEMQLLFHFSFSSWQCLRLKNIQIRHNKFLLSSHKTKIFFCHRRFFALSVLFCVKTDPLTSLEITNKK